jgi:hypothetical protein
MKKEDDKKILENKSKEKIKKIISDEQNNFLSSIDFDNINTITIHKEFSLLLLYTDNNYDIYNHQIEYTIKYNDSTQTEKKQITKKFFEIVYTKPHFIKFLDDDIKIIYFIKNYSI